jgi:hypothetical protein
MVAATARYRQNTRWAFEFTSSGLGRGVVCQQCKVVFLVITLDYSGRYKVHTLRCSHHISSIKLDRYRWYVMSVQFCVYKVGPPPRRLRRPDHTGFHLTSNMLLQSLQHSYMLTTIDGYVRSSSWARLRRAMQDSHYFI